MLTVPIMPFPPNNATNHHFRLLPFRITDMIIRACPGPDPIDMFQACGRLRIRF
jgi:hypothetical protein